MAYYTPCKLPKIRQIVTGGQTWSWVNTLGYDTLKVFLGGAGGGGGSGGSSASSSYTGGGGGGGASGQTIYAIFPLQLGDQISVSVGSGGSSGNNGGATLLTITDTAGNTYTLNASGGNAGASGGDATSSANGTGGAGGSVNGRYYYGSNPNMPRYLLALNSAGANNGSAGTTGGAGGAGGASTTDTTSNQLFFNYDSNLEILGTSGNNNVVGYPIQSGAGGAGGAGTNSSTVNPGATGGDGIAVLLIE